MLYFTTVSRQHVAIIEPSNIDKLKEGKPLLTPDGKIMVAYTPDMEWFQNHFRAMIGISNSSVDAKLLDFLLKEGLKRPTVMR